jgi:hypothetical protein
MLLLAIPSTETLDSVGQLNYLSGVCCDVALMPVLFRQLNSKSSSRLDRPEGFLSV